MSRDSIEMRTSMSRDQAWQVISTYLGSEGFKYLDEKGEPVWRKGAGLATIPQFIKAVPADGSVHLEAWVAAVSWVPGVYTGEQGLDGPWGFALKSALKKRLGALEAALGGNIVSSVKIAAPGAAPQPAPMPAPMPAAAPAQAPVGAAPAAWLADPTGRHQLRYWDGSAWTANVSDNGAVSQDPV
jgi:hypothetical protein